MPLFSYPINLAINADLAFRDQQLIATANLDSGQNNSRALQVAVGRGRSSIQRAGVGSRSNQLSGLNTLNTMRSGINTLLTSGARSQFVISHLGERSEEKFKFSILPAIQCSVRTEAVTTPEVTPGIMIRSDIKFKHFPNPGTDPAIQTLALDKTIIQLVGAFVGDEMQQYEAAAPINAYNTVTYFEEAFIRRGRPVNILLESVNSETDENQKIKINFNVLLHAFRPFVVRHDKAYYLLQGCITDYNPDAVIEIAANSVTPAVAEAARQAINLSNILNPVPGISADVPVTAEGETILGTEDDNDEEDSQAAPSPPSIQREVNTILNPTRPGVVNSIRRPRVVNSIRRPSSAPPAVSEGDAFDLSPFTR